jgi:predicted MFS family arabinose efflux permease
MDRRTLLVLTRLSSSLIAVVLAALVLTGAINVALVMLLSGLATATFGFDAPARLAMMPSVLGPAAVFSGMGTSRAALQSSILIGPLIGGLLIVPIGVGGVLVATAIMYAASLGIVLLMSPHPVSARARATSVRDSIFEAGSHIRQAPIVRSLLLFGLIFAVFAQSYIQLLPAVAHETLHVGAVELSWMVGIGGGGALLGAIISASVGGVRRIGWFLIGVTFLEGLLIVVLGLQRDLAWTLFVLLLIGTLTVTYTGTQSTVIQMTLPDALRGRVMGVLVALLTAGPSLGALLIGTLGALIGISNALLCSGLIVFASGTAIAFRVRAIRGAQLSTGAGDRMAVAMADPVGARLMEDEPPS